MPSFADLIRTARTCRRFDETSLLPASLLREMVDDVRITSCCNNRQPLRYITVTNPAVCGHVFPHLKWAASLADWNGPEMGERPTGYILICSIRPVSNLTYYDTGIAGQSLQLDATDRGLGCCMIHNFSRARLREILEIPADVAPILLLALGFPREERRITDANLGDNLVYWRDEKGVHHVPKLTLDQVLLAEK